MDIVLSADGVELDASLALPERQCGLVLFIHGSGSSRFSPRNRIVADALNRRGLATLLLDLLTIPEHEQDEITGELRFEIELLSRRAMQCIERVGERGSLAHLPLGLFGASTGAAAALNAAAERPDKVAAIVCRGGRPDLALPMLPDVQAPTLFIVGALDHTVLALNREAAAALRATHRIAVVPGASHLFEEPGKLDIVAALARDWFLHHLAGGATAAQANA
ncbi:MAG: dienelactone hydrolase family protein [Gammaproteobacteria bacterium]|nr:dienelactone hydrolase family protein [Gammaproteobacteria bacterium]